MSSQVDVKSAKKKYLAHAANAGQRGIPFNMTFDQWMSVWGDKLQNIGRRGYELQMCRTRDSGPYAIGNVRIDTARANTLEKFDVRREKDIKEAWSFDGEDRSSCADWLTNRRSGDYFDEMD